MTKEEVKLLIAEVLQQYNSNTSNSNQNAQQESQRISQDTLKLASDLANKGAQATSQTNTEQSNADTGNEEVLEVNAAFDQGLLALNKKTNADLFALYGFATFGQYLRQQDALFNQSYRHTEGANTCNVEKIRS
jgi:hypothetical protein